MKGCKIILWCWATQRFGARCTPSVVANLVAGPQLRNQARRKAPAALLALRRLVADGHVWRNLKNVLEESVEQLLQQLIWRGCGNRAAPMRKRREGVSAAVRRWVVVSALVGAVGDVGTAAAADEGQPALCRSRARARTGARYTCAVGSRGEDGASDTTSPLRTSNLLGEGSRAAATDKYAGLVTSNAREPALLKPIIKFGAGTNKLRTVASPVRITLICPDEDAKNDVQEPDLL